MKQEVQIRLEIYEMIHQKFMKSYDVETLNILEKIQREVLSGLSPEVAKQGDATLRVNLGMDNVVYSPSEVEEKVKIGHKCPYYNDDCPKCFPPQTTESGKEMIGYDGSKTPSDGVSGDNGNQTTESTGGASHSNRSTEESNPECIKCDLLKSTILATGQPCLSLSLSTIGPDHNFGNTHPPVEEKGWCRLSLWKVRFAKSDIWEEIRVDGKLVVDKSKLFNFLSQTLTEERGKIYEMVKEKRGIIRKGNQWDAGFDTALEQVLTLLEDNKK